MPIVLNLDTNSPPEHRVRNIPQGMCACCEISQVAVRAGEQSSNFCDDCFSLVHLQCGECEEHGVRASMSRFNFRWILVRHLNSRFRSRFGFANWGGDYPVELSWARYANDFAERISSDPNLYFPEGIDFWQVPEEAPPIWVTMDEEFRCDDCVLHCEDCGERFAFLEEINSVWLCSGCAMPRCSDCGEGWDNERQASRCCGGNGVHEYGWVPNNYNFWTEDNGVLECSTRSSEKQLYFGVELETECGWETFESFLEQANEKADYPDFVWGKTDGSLDETGVELVTMPATLDAFRKRFPWQALATWNDNGARSFHRGSCGFHIHCSRSFFTATHLWRFVAFQMRNQALCQAIAQRGNSSWAKWQTVSDFSKDDEGTLSDVVKGKAENGDRYVAINFQNAETVELRYFRGNLRPEAILLRLEFVDAIARYTKHLSAKQVMDGALTVSEFANWVYDNATRYRTLQGWFQDNEEGTN